jgi:methionyl-tRNA formyltransferase
VNILFAGTPAFAAAALDALLQAGHQVPLVLTQPDRPAGRGLKPQASAVKQLALSKGLAVAQPLTLKDDAVIAQLAAVNADVMVVAAYGLSEYSCLTAAALARRSADPARHSRRRS